MDDAIDEVNKAFCVCGNAFALGDRICRNCGTLRQRQGKNPTAKLLELDTLKMMTDPHSLNSGTLLNIYEQAAQDFDAPELLEISYRNIRGEKLKEVIFIDPVYANSRPRICVAVEGVQAMQGAIGVLSRKVDNLVETLRDCRKAYLAELLYLQNIIGEHKASGTEPAPTRSMDLKDKRECIRFYDPFQFSEETRAESEERKVAEARKEFDKRLTKLQDENRRLEKRITIYERDVGGIDDPRSRVERVLSMISIDKLLHMLTELVEGPVAENYYLAMEKILSDFKGYDISELEYQANDLKQFKESIEGKVNRIEDDLRSTKTQLEKERSSNEKLQQMQEARRKEIMILKAEQTNISDLLNVTELQLTDAAQLASKLQIQLQSQKAAADEERWALEQQLVRERAAFHELEARIKHVMESKQERVLGVGERLESLTANEIQRLGLEVFNSQDVIELCIRHCVDLDDNGWGQFFTEVNEIAATRTERREDLAAKVAERSLGSRESTRKLKINTNDHISALSDLLGNLREDEIKNWVTCLPQNLMKAVIVGGLNASMAINAKQSDQPADSGDGSESDGVGTKHNAIPFAKVMPSINVGKDLSKKVRLELMKRLLKVTLGSDARKLAQIIPEKARQNFILGILEKSSPRDLKKIGEATSNNIILGLVDGLVPEDAFTVITFLKGRTTGTFEHESLPAIKRRADRRLSSARLSAPAQNARLGSKSKKLRSQHSSDKSEMSDLFFEEAVSVKFLEDNLSAASAKLLEGSISAKGQGIRSDPEIKLSTIIPASENEGPTIICKSSTEVAKETFEHIGREPSVVSVEHANEIDARASNQMTSGVTESDYLGDEDRVSKQYTMEGSEDSDLPKSEDEPRSRACNLVIGTQTELSIWTHIDGDVNIQVYGDHHMLGRDVRDEFMKVARRFIGDSDESASLSENQRPSMTFFDWARSSISVAPSIINEERDENANEQADAEVLQPTVVTSGLQVRRSFEGQEHDSHFDAIAVVDCESSVVAVDAGWFAPPSDVSRDAPEEARVNSILDHGMDVLSQMQRSKNGLQQASALVKDQLMILCSLSETEVGSWHQFMENARDALINACTEESEEARRQFEQSHLMLRGARWLRFSALFSSICHNEAIVLIGGTKASAWLEIQKALSCLADELLQAKLEAKSDSSRAEELSYAEPRGVNLIANLAHARAKLCSISSLRWAALWEIYAKSEVALSMAHQSEVVDATDLRDHAAKEIILEAKQHMNAVYDSIASLEGLMAAQKPSLLKDSTRRQSDANYTNATLCWTVDMKFAAKQVAHLQRESNSAIFSSELEPNNTKLKYLRKVAIEKVNAAERRQAIAFRSCLDRAEIDIMADYTNVEAHRFAAHLRTELMALAKRQLASSEKEFLDFFYDLRQQRSLAGQADAKEIWSKLMSAGRTVKKLLFEGIVVAESEQVFPVAGMLNLQGTLSESLEELERFKVREVDVLRHALEQAKAALEETPEKQSKDEAVTNVLLLQSSFDAAVDQIGRHHMPRQYQFSPKESKQQQGLHNAATVEHQKMDEAEHSNDDVAMSANPQALMPNQDNVSLLSSMRADVNPRDREAPERAIEDDKQNVAVISECQPTMAAGIAVGAPGEVIVGSAASDVPMDMRQILMEMLERVDLGEVYEITSKFLQDCHVALTRAQHSVASNPKDKCAWKEIHRVHVCLSERLAKQLVTIARSFLKGTGSKREDYLCALDAQDNLLSVADLLRGFLGAGKPVDEDASTTTATAEVGDFSGNSFFHQEGFMSNNRAIQRRSVPPTTSPMSMAASNLEKKRQHTPRTPRVVVDVFEGEDSGRGANDSACGTGGIGVRRNMRIATTDGLLGTLMYRSLRPSREQDCGPHMNNEPIRHLGNSIGHLLGTMDWDCLSESFAQSDGESAASEPLHGVTRSMPDNDELPAEQVLADPPPMFPPADKSKTFRLPPTPRGTKCEPLGYGGDTHATFDPQDVDDHFTRKKRLHSLSRKSARKHIFQAHIKSTSMTKAGGASCDESDVNPRRSGGASPKTLELFQLEVRALAQPSPRQQQAGSKLSVADGDDTVLQSVQQPWVRIGSKEPTDPWKPTIRFKKRRPTLRSKQDPVGKLFNYPITTAPDGASLPFGESRLEVFGNMSLVASSFAPTKPPTPRITLHDKVASHPTESPKGIPSNGGPGVRSITAGDSRYGLFAAHRRVESSAGGKQIGASILEVPEFSLDAARPHTTGTRARAFLVQGV